jgi:hypothetical protein
LAVIDDLRAMKSVLAEAIEAIDAALPLLERLDPVVAAWRSNGVLVEAVAAATARPNGSAEPAPRGGHVQTYCSERCRQRAHYHRQQKRKQAPPPASPVGAEPAGQDHHPAAPPAAPPAAHSRPREAAQKPEVFDRPFRTSTDAPERAAFLQVPKLPWEAGLQRGS